MTNTSVKKFPTWLNIAACLFLILFLSLANWQGQRGYQKQRYLAELKQGNPIIETTKLIDSHNNLMVGQPVALTGKFDNKHFFLLENHIIQSRAGYLVIQPFILDSEHSILVNRGWIPKLNLQESQNFIEPIDKTITIRGQLYQPKHNVFITQNFNKIEWPQKALEIDTEGFAQRLGHPGLIKMVVNLHSESPYSFIGPNPLGYEMTPQKHYGYMVQWLLFACILIGIWLWAHKRNRSTSHD